MLSGRSDYGIPGAARRPRLARSTQLVFEIGKLGFRPLVSELVDVLVYFFGGAEVSLQDASQRRQWRIGFICSRKMSSSAFKMNFDRVSDLDGQLTTQFRRQGDGVPTGDLGFVNRTLWFNV